jgi:hypothetical protein
MTSPQPEAPITDEKPVSPEPEPNPAPESDRPERESRANAFAHGCAGSTIMTPADQIEADHLYDMLEDTYDPKTDYEEELLHEVARERTLLKRCQTNLFALTELEMNAAELHWDEDQEQAVQELALRLPKAPGLVRVQLSQTPHGAALQDEHWMRLGMAIDQAGEWTDGQRHMALDLLGVPWELREKGQTEVDAQPGQDPRAVARAVVDEEIARLRNPQAVARRQQRAEYHRCLASQGNPAQVSKEKRLMERYGNMHARRADRAMAEFERIRAARLKFESLATSCPSAYVAEMEPRAKVQAARQEAAAAREAAQPAPAAASAAAARPSWSNPKSSPSRPQDLARERAKERAKAKRQAERDARKKQQKKHKNR